MDMERVEETDRECNWALVSIEQQRIDVNPLMFSIDRVQVFTCWEYLCFWWF